jgi:amidophosphoribosyltransferase
MSNLHEECGVFGVYSPIESDVSRTAYYGLYALQHRGQESCGVVVCQDGLFYSHKDLGLVGDVFTEDVLSSLPQGNMAIGHVRYGTTGGTNRANCQPIEVNHLKGRLAIAHNGNLSNAFELRSELEMGGAIFHTTSDTEIIAYTVIQERILCDSIEEAISKAVRKLDGAYSLILMSATKLIAARDKYGMRPLCFGKAPDGAYIAASESCALAAVGAEFIRDVEPGEIVVFDETGVHSMRSDCSHFRRSFCAFEYIYFARPDSCIEGISVHASRKKAGELLAKRHPVQADVVIGVPDSGLDAALGYSARSGVPYGIGFIKNKYIGRTFISPGQDDRHNLVKIKLSPIKDTVCGKRVIMIDDSIVRGTTSAQIVKLLREAGAREIHVRISSPQFLNPCYYGTDIDSKENLISCKHPPEEVARIIGADSLGFLSPDDLDLICPGVGLCKACFTGEYPTEVPEHTEKDRFERRLSEAKAYNI